MKRLVLTPLTVGDLNQIWDCIADGSIEAADRVIHDIEKTLEQLAVHPGIGHLRKIWPMSATDSSLFTRT